MIKPESIKGHRLIGALWYYHCECGKPEGPLLLTGFEDGPRTQSILLTGDGLLASMSHLKTPEFLTVREVGREPCTSPRLAANYGHTEHVYYEWDFR